MGTSPAAKKMRRVGISTLAEKGREFMPGDELKGEPDGMESMGFLYSVDPQLAGF